MQIQDLFKELSDCDEVRAITLGGSRATGKNDDKSDYDVYVYVNSELPAGKRRDILSKYCSRMEIGNHYWEPEDNCVLNDGADIDIIYRNLEVFMEGISRVVDDAQACNGYTTCMWHNLITCKIIYDIDGKLEEYQKRYNIPYPQELKKNIIIRNMNLLSGCLPSYDMQIKKAAGRGDFNSVNHRITEFLASYFDVIFALNEMTHPGEKRLVSICKEHCRILPDNFEENLKFLFESIMKHNVHNVAESIVLELKKVCSEYYK